MTMTAVVNSQNEKVGEVDLNEALFGLRVDPHLLHDLVRMQMANRRSGNASTKTRAEVRGSSRKPWKQKGTGRARAGSVRSPLWRGGGTTFGPKPRDYSYKLPKKVRRLGLRMALSTRCNEEQLMIVDAIQLEQIKTKKFLSVMKALNIENALFVIPERDETLERSCRNIPGVKVLPANGLNVYDVLLHHHLVLLQPCLEQLEARLLS